MRRVTRNLFPTFGLLLAIGCAVQVSSPLPSGHQENALRSSSTNMSYSVLHAFKGRGDGAFPSSPLIAANSALYGTTGAGGRGVCNRRCGTIFQWRNGLERVVYRFGGAPNDGADSNAGLVLLGRKFYGTTAAGGEATASCDLLPKIPGCGTVFSMSLSGTEKVVYRFKGGADGMLPYAGLVVMGTELFGTVSSGGSTSTNGDGVGLVFAVKPSGEERVVYRFGGRSDDGAYPDGTLVVLGGTLYGTTNEGGTGQTCPYGCGTVFAVTSHGREQVLHSFKGGRDGALPWAGLTTWHGMLYGTTTHGGSHNKGTVFVVTPSGGERVIYAFKGGADGDLPYGGVLFLNGYLYGTTQFGGAFNSGTIFELSSSGEERVLYSFTGSGGGANPGSGLIAVHRRLYGTTVFGGDYVPACGTGLGCGSIFSFKL